MKINIWSDIRCPFCYIGKRKFEAALEKFPHKDKIEIIWRSFQLDPRLKTQTDISPYDYFARLKGQTRAEAEEMHQHVTQIAKQVGLDFNFDNAVVANSFNAHRLIQFARTKGLGDEAEEQLFKAYFTDSKNIDDKAVLLEIGISIGLEKSAVKEVLSSDAYAKEVKEDELRAQAIGVRGVPFFVFDDKRAVSGAQAPEVFLETLKESWAEFEEGKKELIISSSGESCSTNGSC